MTMRYANVWKGMWAEGKEGEKDEGERCRWRAAEGEEEDINEGGKDGERSVASEGIRDWRKV